MRRCEPMDRAILRFFALRQRNCYNNSTGNINMKKVFFLTLLSTYAVLCGCASTVIHTKDPDLVAKYQQALENSKACKTDADCVAIAKGCCLCDGQEAVNKKFQADLDEQREKACGIGPCTLQMCYTDIDVACVNNVCTGTLKPMSSYIPE